MNSYAKLKYKFLHNFFEKKRLENRVKFLLKLKKNLKIQDNYTLLKVTI